MTLAGLIARDMNRWLILYRKLARQTSKQNIFYGSSESCFKMLVWNLGTLYGIKRIFKDSKIQIHLFIKITWFQHGLIHWHWYWTIVEFYPFHLLITVDVDILIKAWSRCHKDHHKWKRIDTPCNTVFRTRFKNMWPRAVSKVGRVIYI